MALLNIKDLCINYGMIQAVKGVDFTVEQGEIVALIGANGAGKTSILHTLTGLIPAKSGSIEFDSKDITKMPAYTRKDKAEIDESIKAIYKRFPRLEERKSQLSGTLSGGEQQMLAMGRALMSKPKVIVMDEPSMGLSPLYVNEIFDIIDEIHKAGTTVLLVEQNAKKALSIADRAYVLETGKIVLSGKASDLLNDESVKKAYLSE